MKNKIALLIGGHSTEFDASIRSFETVVHACNSENSIIEVTAVIFVDANDIYIHEKQIPLTRFELKRADRVVGLDQLPNELSKLDVYIFSLLHGNEGEDGCLQGLAEIYQIDGSFGEVLPSALSMNKWQMAEFVESITNKEIRKIPYLIVNKQVDSQAISKFISENPSEYYILKPNRLGASLFTKKVERNHVLEEIHKSEEVFNYDRDLLLQKYILGREFTVGVIEKNNDLMVLPIVEIFTNNQFLGHDEKHQKGLVNVKFDELEEDLKQRIVNECGHVFRKTGFSNFCRFDIIFSNDTLYFLEANSIPGLMKSSIFIKMLEMKNISITQMIQYFIENYSSKYRISKKYRYEIAE